MPGIALETRIHSDGQNKQKAFWGDGHFSDNHTVCIIVKRSEPDEENTFFLGFYTQLSHHSAVKAK